MFHCQKFYIVNNSSTSNVQFGVQNIFHIFLIICCITNILLRIEEEKERCHKVLNISSFSQWEDVIPLFVLQNLGDNYERAIIAKYFQSLVY